METLADDARVAELRSAGLPFSLIGRTADTSELSYVDLDFGAAVRVGLKYLAELGHRCVALFNFPEHQLAAGYTSALIAQDAFEKGARRPASAASISAAPTRRTRRMRSPRTSSRPSPTAPRPSPRAASSAVSSPLCARPISGSPTISRSSR